MPLISVQSVFEQHQGMVWKVWCQEQLLLGHKSCPPPIAEPLHDIHDLNNRFIRGDVHLAAGLDVVHGQAQEHPLGQNFVRLDGILLLLSSGACGFFLFMLFCWRLLLRLLLPPLLLLLLLLLRLFLLLP